MSGTLHKARETLHQWVRLVQSQDDDVAKEILWPDLQVHAYEEGPKGPLTVYDGQDAVLAWVKHPPLGRFRFRLLSVRERPAHPALPKAQTTLEAVYEVDLADGDFCNQGTWVAAIEAGRLRGLLHTPQSLPD